MLAKTQNSYNTEEEFVLTQFESTSNLAPKIPEPVKAEFSKGQEYKPDVFALPPEFWSRLNSDHGVASEIERIIAAEVEKRYQVIESQNGEVLKRRLNELEETQKVQLEIVKKEAFEKGIQEARIKGAQDFENEKQEWIAQVECLKKEMATWSEKLIEEKQQLLGSHQKDWLMAFSKLLKRFLVNHSGQIENGIGQWLETQVAQFKSEEKIKLFVPKEQFERLQKSTVSPVSATFEVLLDPALAANSFRVESQSGGCFFSPEEQISQLEKIISDSLNSGE